MEEIYCSFCKWGWPGTKCSCCARLVYTAPELLMSQSTPITLPPGMTPSSVAPSNTLYGNLSKEPMAPPIIKDTRTSAKRKLLPEFETSDPEDIGSPEREPMIKRVPTAPRRTRVSKAHLSSEKPQHKGIMSTLVSSLHPSISLLEELFVISGGTQTKMRFSHTRLPRTVRGSLVLTIGASRISPAGETVSDISVVFQ